jgi:membrane-bound lytic murein transglycosylase D
MKYLFIAISVLLVSGCALTDTIETGDLATADLTVTCKAGEPKTAKHNPRNCDEAQEGIVQIIHPQEPVMVPLPEPLEVSEQKVADVWVHIANNLEFGVPKNEPRLEAQKRWFLKHPNYMRRVSERARPFLYYIVEELEKQDIPLDIALLPIVESAFDPLAYSHGRASGMWQFISATGKRFGMKQGWWYDGRRDVVASTQGAIDYLKYLHEMFDGDWMHALAAYNSGEGRVQRSIRKNRRAGKSTDFWSLDLPRETRAYVPKLLALADILKNSEAYNFSWPNIDNSPVIQIVDIESQLDLAMAAQMASLTLAELRALNPGFNHWATDPDGPHQLVLPIDKVEAFTLALAQTPKEGRISWARHKVRSGDSIGKIAQKYRSSIDVIKRVNSMTNNTIYINDHILVPVATTDAQASMLNHPQNSRVIGNNNASQRIVHTIASGDTLSAIALIHKVSVKDLAQWNNISANSTLNIGTQLVVYSPSQVSDTYKTRTITYSVRNGDSLSRIANKFNVTIGDIVRWNDISKQKYLQPGQRLRLIIDLTNT